MTLKEGQSPAPRGQAADIDSSIHALSGGQRIDLTMDPRDAQSLAHAVRAASGETWKPCEGRLHYSVYGRGDPVLMIHGLGCSGEDWALQIVALEGRFRLIVPDLPGCGASAPPRGGYSIVGFASTLWALLNHLGVPRVDIVGFSMGGAVALEMALQCSARVPRLALINSLASYRDDWRKWSYARASEMTIRLLGMRRAARRFAAELFPEPWQAGLRDRAAQVVGTVPASRYLSLVDALERWTASDGFDGVTSRTLVIAAEHDYGSLAEKRELAARLRGDLVVVRGSRHATPFDASEATNASLLAFLTDDPAPPEDRLVRDTPDRARAVSRVRSMVEGQACALEI